MTSFFRPRTVRNSFWPSLALTWFFGGASVKMRRPWRILYSVTATIFFIFFHAYGLPGNNHPSTASTKLLQYVIQLIEYLRIWAIIAVIWSWELKGAKVVENAIIELEEIDKRLGDFCMEINYRKFVFKQLITFGGFLFFSILGEKLKEWPVFGNRKPEASLGIWQRLSDTVSFNAQFFQAMIADIVLTMVLDSFYVRFKLSNELLKEIAESKRLVINIRAFATSCYRELDSVSKRTTLKFYEKREGNSYLVMRRIDEICELHRSLLREAENLRNAFSLQLSVSFANLFILILQKTLALLLSVKTNTEINFFIVCGNIVAIIFIIVRYWHVILSCSKISDEVTELGVSLYLIPIKDTALHNQLQEHSVRLIQRQLAFTAGGIFTINRGLVISIFSSFLTYLIILIQMQDIN